MPPGAPPIIPSVGAQTSIRPAPARESSPGEPLITNAPMLSRRSTPDARRPGGLPPGAPLGMVPLDVLLVSAVALSIMPAAIPDAPTVAGARFHKAEWVTEHVHTTPQCPWCIIPGAAPTPVGDDPHRSTSSG